MRLIHAATLAALLLFVSPASAENFTLACLQVKDAYLLAEEAKMVVVKPNQQPYNAMYYLQAMQTRFGWKNPISALILGCMEVPEGKYVLGRQLKKVNVDFPGTALSFEIFQARTVKKKRPIWVVVVAATQNI